MYQGTAFSRARKPLKTNWALAPATTLLEENIILEVNEQTILLAVKALGVAKLGLYLDDRFPESRFILPLLYGPHQRVNE